MAYLVDFLNWCWQHIINLSTVQVSVGVAAIGVFYAFRAFGLNSKAFYTQNRAWVCVERVRDSTGYLGPNRTLQVDVLNAGKTPASGAAKVAVIQSATLPTQQEIASALDTATVEEGVIAPSQSLILATDGSLKYTANGTDDVYVVGEVKYATLGKAGKTTFCIVVDHPTYRAKGGNAFNEMI
jgi:hypothetical protein